MIGEANDVPPAPDQLIGAPVLGREPVVEIGRGPILQTVYEGDQGRLRLDGALQQQLQMIEPEIDRQRAPIIGGPRLGTRVAGKNDRPLVTDRLSHRGRRSRERKIPRAKSDRAQRDSQNIAENYEVSLIRVK